MPSMRLLAMSLLLTGALSGCGAGTAAHEPAGTAVRTEDAPSRGAFHAAPYRLENSFRGLRLAAKSGRWIDIDSNYCWDSARRHRIPIATHWPHIGADQFTDPAGRINEDAAFADLTLPEVRRLRRRRGSGLGAAARERPARQPGGHDQAAEQARRCRTR